MIVLAALLTGCIAAAPFPCGPGGAACGPGGTCEPTGYCSFPDQSCASGRRYGEYAGPGYGAACVAPPGPPDAAPPDARILGPFGAPVPVAELNSGNDDDPTLTADLLEIYFNSYRSGGLGSGDIWRATRPTAGGPWSSPVNVLELNSASEENAPEVSADGLAIFLVSDRPGGPGQRDVYVSTRSSRAASWSAPVLVAELSGPTVDFDPTPSADLLRMYMAVGPDPAGMDLYLAARPSTAQAWGPRTIIAELASPDQDVAPSLDPTETTLFFASTRAGGMGRLDLWTATRVTRAAPFEAPQPVAELNSTADDSDPWLSADQRILYFASNRSGPLELYVATR